MSQLPSPNQREWGRRLVDEGVDLLLGHHPHVLQPIEVVKGVPLAYSLGDFTFSSTFWHGINTMSGNAFLSRFHVHALSRETGWMEVVLEKSLQSRFQFCHARLARDLTVVADCSTARQCRWRRLATRLDEPPYPGTLAEEEAAASKRDHWRMNARRPLRWATLKLLRRGWLIGCYVEPYGFGWRPRIKDR